MSERRVALTFDAEHPSRAPNLADGPERILRALEGASVRATFFLQGRWASAYPETAARIAGAGHLVGSHSHFHAPMPLLSPEGFDTDIREAEARIGDAAGVDPRPWFRCPFGRGLGDPHVEERLEALGYRNVGWDVDSSDWAQGRDQEAVVSAVVDGVRSRLGASVVLFHTWPAVTAATLPAVLAALAAEEVVFATLDEVLG